MSLIRTVALPVLLVSAACTNPAGPPGAQPVIAALPRPLTAVETEMVSAANAFGVNLFKAVNESFADSNVFMSPLSASMALGMTMNGAEGTTFTEMRSALGFGARTHEELNGAYRSLIGLLRGLDPKVDFRIANAIYHGLSFGPFVEQAFLDESKQFFDAEIKGLDFAAPQSVDVVNDWANRNTYGRIPTILDRIDPDLVMLLMNAIYFKGDWRERFKESDTRNEPFRALRGEVSVPTMHRTGGFRYARSGSATVAELPYGGDAFVMTILMPDEDVNINTFVSQLTSDTWQAATASLHDSKVPFSMPKFRMAWEDTLNNELQALGMRRAFQPDNAEFTRISRNAGNHLYIDFVKQKAFVEVNEVGTEAAAVTVVGIMPTSMPQPVDINRPFVFVIRERLSGTVLFIGKVVEPKLAD